MTSMAWDIPSSGVLDDAGNRELSAGGNTYYFGKSCVCPTLVPFLIIFIISFYLYKKKGHH